MNRRAVPMLVVLVAISLALSIAGCHHKPSPHEYDRSCKSVIDCAAVYIGPLGCCSEPCPNSAVRATVAEQAHNDVEAARDCKGPTPPCLPPTQAQCPDGRVLCEQGTCTLVVSSQDASAPPACALTDGGICAPQTPDTSCTSRVGSPYDRVNRCVSPTLETLACCATRNGTECTQEAALDCVMPTNGETMIWRTNGTWSAPGFALCDDATRRLVTSVPSCGR